MKVLLMQRDKKINELMDSNRQLSTDRYEYFPDGATNMRSPQQSDFLTNIHKK